MRSTTRLRARETIGQTLAVARRDGPLYQLMAPHEAAWMIGIEPIISGLGSLTGGWFLDRRGTRRSLGQEDEACRRPRSSGGV